MTTPLNDRYEDGKDVSLLAKDQYFCDLAWAKENKLTLQEEEMLLARIQRAKADPSNAWLQNIAKHARASLVEAYQLFVYSIARRYQRSIHCFDILDLVQEGMIGLLHAFEVVDATDPETFRSFATFRVRGAICTALAERGGSVRLDAGAMNHVRALRHASDSVSEELDRDASVEEVAAELQISVERVYEVQGWMQSTAALSLQSLLPEDADTSFEDRYPVESVFASRVSHDEDHQEASREFLDQTLGRAVTEVQRRTLRLRFGLDEAWQGGLGHREVAEILGVSKTCVIRAEQRGLDRLRDALDLVVKDGTVGCALRSVYQQDEYYTAAEAAAVLKVAHRMLVWHAARGHYSAERRQYKSRFQWVFPKQVIDALLAEREEVSA